MPSGTILCVDDDPTVLRALRSLLSKLGSDHEVEIAESGGEALEIESELRSQGRDVAVVVSDFIMPGMRGDEFLIRLHQTSPKVVKILLTGQSDFEGVKRAINQANLYRFLEKPFNNDDLLLTIRTACVAFHHERELLQQNAKLMALNLELESALDKLGSQQEQLARSEARATVSTLVASVSHELGTPIGNGVLTAGMLTELAAKFKVLADSGKITRTALGEFVGSVSEGSVLLQRNLERASELLLSFKQVTADQASEQRREFDLATAVREVIETMMPSLRSKPHRVVIDIPPGIVMDSYPGALGQVVINLVNNAYLHAFEGRSPGVLTITGAAQDAGVHLSFSDNGVGMSADHLARLLEPFFSTKIGRGGTGLGMSIVNNLVRKSLGGTLAVNSTPGTGTTVDVTLPCSAPGHVSDAPKPHVQP